MRVTVLPLGLGPINQDWDCVWWVRFALDTLLERLTPFLWSFATSFVDFETISSPERKKESEKSSLLTVAREKLSFLLEISVALVKSRTFCWQSLDLTIIFIPYLEVWWWIHLSLPKRGPWEPTWALWAIPDRSCWDISLILSFPKMPTYDLDQKITSSLKIGQAGFKSRWWSSQEKNDVLNEKKESFVMNAERSHSRFRQVPWHVPCVSWIIHLLWFMTGFEMKVKSNAPIHSSAPRQAQLVNGALEHPFSFVFLIFPEFCSGIHSHTKNRFWWQNDAKILMDDLDQFWASKSVNNAISSDRCHHHHHRYPALVWIPYIMLRSRNFSLCFMFSSCLCTTLKAILRHFNAWLHTWMHFIQSHFVKWSTLLENKSWWLVTKLFALHHHHHSTKENKMGVTKVGPFREWRVSHVEWDGKGSIQTPCGAHPSQWEVQARAIFYFQAWFVDRNSCNSIRHHFGRVSDPTSTALPLDDNQWKKVGWEKERHIVGLDDGFSFRGEADVTFKTFQTDPGKTDCTWNTQFGFILMDWTSENNYGGQVASLQITSFKG